MNMKLTLISAAASLLCLAATHALAGQQLVVEKNHVARISLPAAAGSVIVGNPDIADVNVVDSHTVYVIGKGFGSSAVTVTGRDGRPLYDGEVVVTAAQKGAITVYKGLKPTLMVCSNICISQDADSSNTTPAATPVTPAGMMSMAPVGQGAGAAGNTIGALGGGTAMQVQ